MILVIKVAAVTLSLINLFYAYGTGRRLYKFDQDSSGRWADLMILLYILFQEAVIIGLWLT